MKHILPPWIDYIQLESKAHLYGFKPFSLDHLYYILGLFEMLPSQNSELIDDAGYLRLNSSILQYHVHNYKDYINFLVDNYIIDAPAKNGYLVGEFSKRYKLNIPDGVTTLLPVEKDFVSDAFEKKIVKSRKNKFPASVSYITQYLEGLEINYEDAIDFIEKEREKKVKSGVWDVKLVRGRNSMEERFIDPDNQALSMIYAVVRIKNNDKYASVDTFGWRLHTNISNLSKSLKPFLTYMGMKLGAIDIKNSQPFFCLKIFQEEFWRKGAHNILKGINIKDVSTIIMLVESLKRTHYEELNRFTELVLNGELYEYYSEELSKELAKIFSREKAKVGLLLVLFSKNRCSVPEKTVFKKLFPQIYKIFSAVKMVDHKALSAILQRIESHVVISIICKRISKDFPRVPIFTIHDSIVTPVKYLEYIRKITLLEINNYIGFEPRLVTEYWE